jgi:hypothetical protein
MGNSKRRARSLKTAGLFSRIFALSPEIRYAALLYDGTLKKCARPDLAGASSSDSDRYEELIVNPTMLTLLRQRANIDCGGLDYVIVGYGNFIAFVRPLRTGHFAVAFETACDYRLLLPSVESVLKKAGLR